MPRGDEPPRPPTPEGFFLGFQEADSSFIMPSPDPEDPMGYMLDAARAIAQGAAKKALKSAVRVWHGDRAAAVVEVVMGAQLFDKTLLRMYDAVGDVATETAMRFLQDAAAEIYDANRRSHRDRAATEFGESYTAFKKEAAEATTGLKGLIVSSEAKAEYHRKAAGAALGVALINYHMGSNTAVTWADDASEQYACYGRN
jgi:hypothetical protein